MDVMIRSLDIASIVPFSIVIAFALLVLLLEVAQRPSLSRAYLAKVSALGFGIAGVAALFLMRADGYYTFHQMNFLDGYTQIFTILYCLAGGLTALVAAPYLTEHGYDRGEFYALLLFSVGGMIIMTSAADLIVFFIGLEIMSISGYALTAYFRGSKFSAEAGLKYFFIGAFATAFFLYGVAFIYGVTGTTNLIEIGQVLSQQSCTTPDMQVISHTTQDAIFAGASGITSDAGAALSIQPTGEWIAKLPLAIVGLFMILVAFAVKVAAAPFHMWAPDAYTGAPTPVVGFLAAAVKAAGFAALTRILILAFFGTELRMGEFGWVQIFFFLALLSMLVGNLVAIAQTNIKRMLAYSSVAHAGYLMVGLAAMGYGHGTIQMAEGLVFYLVAYTFGTIGAFGVLAYLGKRGTVVEKFDDLNGVGRQHPALGIAMLLFMLSSAGIPPAAGFIGKFMLFKAAIVAAVQGQADGHQGWMLLVLLVSLGILVSVAGVYYYLRVVVHMFMKDSDREVGLLHDNGAKFAIAVCALATLVLGLLPNKLMNLSTRALDQMAGRPDCVYVEYEDSEPVSVISRQELLRNR